MLDHAAAVFPDGTYKASQSTLSVGVSASLAHGQAPSQILFPTVPASNSTTEGMGATHIRVIVNPFTSGSISPSIALL